ncbi:LOW QUALITY PROTEIN: protein mono-ADP-ribosyltransferase PARP10 [Tachyglossus aculeatus]|uniref:LOW QUALITY PROTEIN: protein mono-ADP-ribosyltransferase PARP10 n=1 Tax=Tachyglossus aculeatus TaxID=9261 RepID=UPI0018F37467|nr:LOW QUALITY PROTEIN: protein mono-ADP-ribosyltransferase PARP10 [Tachyglossus aculeatus]
MVRGRPSGARWTNRRLPPSPGLAPRCLLSQTLQCPLDQLLLASHCLPQTLQPFGARWTTCYLLPIAFPKPFGAHWTTCYLLPIAFPKPSSAHWANCRLPSSPGLAPCCLPQTLRPFDAHCINHCLLPVASPKPSDARWANHRFPSSPGAAHVPSRADHVPRGGPLVLGPGGPRDPRWLLLRGLKPGTAPDLLELYVETLLGAGRAEPGHDGRDHEPCTIFPGPRPGQALVQLAFPLLDTELEDLVARASQRPLEGATVTVAWVPRPQAVRVRLLDGGPLDLELLELYFESPRRSGGGVLEGLRALPGQQGVVIAFQHWNVAERVLQKSHRLQGSELGVTPHYDFLEPGDKDRGPETQESGPVEPGDSDLGGRGAPGSPAAVGALEPVDVLLPPETPESVGPKGPPASPAGALSERLTAAQPEPLPPGAPMGPGGDAVGPEEPVEPGEALVPMEPGALRYLQLHHQELLTGLQDVVLCPLDASDVAGFRLSGEPQACQAAAEFLQSLLGSIGCQTLPLTLPGSARFLLSAEGQTLLRDLEVRFQCAIGTERLTWGPPDAEPEPPELPLGRTPDGLPRDADAGAADSLEEIKALLVALEGPEEEEEEPLPNQPPRWAAKPELEENLEEELYRADRSQEQLAPPGWGAWGEEEEEEDGEAEDEAAEGALAEARQRSLASFRREQNLDEEAALLLALQRSLDLREPEQEDLQRALALSLLEVRGAERDPALGRLIVHVAFERDPAELEAALEEALKAHLSEEIVVGLELQALPGGLLACLERDYGVSVTLSGDVATLRGFGPHPARAARRLAAHLGLDLPRALARTQSRDAPCPSPVPRSASPPAGLLLPADVGEEEVRLEPLEESGEEFQKIIRDFYGSLDDAHEIRVVKVERLLHPLLQRQYELQRQRLERLCPRRPVERTLYHGTSAQAVPEICLHGFSRNFCGLHAALYGQGVYFAAQAGLSVQDQYSPCDARGYKAVFVARVLTGEYTAGKAGLRAPPLRQGPGSAPLRYDSVVDCPRQPSIFVIFHDTQAVPAFLITCQRRPSPASGPAVPGADPAP